MEYTVRKFEGKIKAKNYFIDNKNITLIAGEKVSEEIYNKFTKLARVKLFEGENSKEAPRKEPKNTHKKK